MSYVPSAFIFLDDFLLDLGLLPDLESLTSFLLLFPFDGFLSFLESALESSDLVEFFLDFLVTLLLDLPFDDFLESFELLLDFLPESFEILESVDFFLDFLVLFDFFLSESLDDFRESLEDFLDDLPELFLDFLPLPFLFSDFELFIDLPDFFDPSESTDFYDLFLLFPLSLLLAF